MANMMELLTSIGIKPNQCRLHTEPTEYLFANFGRAGISPQANVIYLCTADEMQAFLAFRSCGVILMSESPCEIPDVSCEYCVVPFYDQVELMCALQEQIISSQRKNRLGELRHRIVVHNPNLGSVVHNICEIIGNPIAVFDSSYNVLAMESMGFPVENRVWNVAKEQGCFPSEIVEEFRATIGERDVSKIPFLCATHAWTDMHCLIMQLTSRAGKLLGSVAVYETFKGFTSEDISVVQEIAALLTEYLETFFDEKSQNNSCTALIRELAEGAALDSAALNRRLEECGWQNHNFYCVGFIHLADDQTKERQREYFCNNISSVSENVMAITKQKNILILICGDELQEFEHLIGSVSEILKKNGLIMGISRCFSDIGDLRAMYKTAKESQLIGSKLFDNDNIFLSQDVMFYSLIKDLSPQNIRKLYDSTSYAAINSFDIKHQTNYCETLITYFSNMLRSTQTAEKLYIHKNSLLYRLNRVGTLFGLNLENFHDIFDFWLGYKLHIYILSLEKEKQSE